MNLKNSPVFPVFPSAVRGRMVRYFALGLQPAVRVTRTRPHHRGLLDGRPSLGLPPLHLAPLALRLDQLVPVSPVLAVVVGAARRRLPAPVPVPPVRLARPARLFALVVRRPPVPVSVPDRETKQPNQCGF